MLPLIDMRDLPSFIISRTFKQERYCFFGFIIFLLIFSNFFSSFREFLLGFNIFVFLFIFGSNSL